jgi:hypothetical protein
MKRSLVTVLFAAALLAPLPVHPAVASAGSTASQGGCAACAALVRGAGDAASPNIVLDPVQGPAQLGPEQTAAYSISIRNEGGTAAPIWLEIDFDAPLSPGGTILADAGFFCTGQTQRYVCEGGALADGEATTVNFDVYASASGDAMIRVSASAQGMAQTAATAPYEVRVGGVPTDVNPRPVS